MHLQYFDGETQVTSDADLERILRSVRNGPYGAFVLWHDNDGSLLNIHINGDIAYVHYFKALDGSHPGYQASGMTPHQCPPTVHFLQTDGSEGGAFAMISEALLPVDAACEAARDYFRRDALPTSISWLELCV